MVVVVAVGAKADTPVIDSVARRKDLMVAFVLGVKNECDVCCLRSKGINLNIRCHPSSVSFFFEYI